MISRGNVPRNRRRYTLVSSKTGRPSGIRAMSNGSALSSRRASARPYADESCWPTISPAVPATVTAAYIGNSKSSVTVS